MCNNTVKDKSEHLQIGFLAQPYLDPNYRKVTIKTFAYYIKIEYNLSQAPFRGASFHCISDKNDCYQESLHKF